MLHQTQSQKQQLKIFPKQLELLNLLHLNCLELEQRIQNELVENPLMEESHSSEEQPQAEQSPVEDYKDWDEFADNDIPDYKTELGNFLHTTEMPSRPLVEREDFRKELREQIKFLNFSEKEKEWANYLINSMNDHGMIEQDLSSIAEDISFKECIWLEAVQLEPVLHKIQQLEPVGIASRSIRECLLIQLKRKIGQGKEVELAIRLLEDHYEDLANRNLEKIKRSLGVEEAEVKNLIHLIGTLRMRPLASEDDALSAIESIVPDFIVTQVDDDFEVSLTRPRSHMLYVNQSLMSRYQEKKNADAKAHQYLKSKLNSALWFIDAIKQREENMLRVMKAIVDIQKDYFREGDIKFLKPMVLRNIASRVKVDISTVSRITCNKYASTPFGTILLKNLFSEGIVNLHGALISNRVIQSAIKDVIAEEDRNKPYTDQQLAVILMNKGYSVARRTVTKYREQLHIPMAQFRAMLV
jgi:RNA polymerase sigma-54 factor